MTGSEPSPPYPAGLFRGQMPMWMTWAAAWAGHEGPDTSRPFRYADLGCGHGLTACWVKRCYPHAEVYGVELDPTQVAASCATAEAMSVDVTFLSGRFEELDLPPLDFAVVRGVWSWIDGGARHALVDLLARRLRPRGLVYVDYNALPGRSDWAPLARLVRQVAARQEGTGPAARLTGALSALQATETSGFFARQPGYASTLLAALAGDPGEVVHELAAQAWHAELLSEVAEALAPAGLRFAASTHLADGVESAWSAEERDALAGWTEPVLRHTMRDFLRHTAFRHDVFCRGEGPMAESRRHEILLARHYAHTSAPEGGLDPHARDLLGALDTPRTGRELVAAGGEGDGVVLERLGRLCASGHVMPADAQLFPAAVDDLMAWSTDAMQVLSPAGIEFTFTRVDRAIWCARGVEDVVGASLARLAAEGHRLEGSEAPSAQRSAMAGQVQAFCASVPSLVRAGWPVSEALWAIGP